MAELEGPLLDLLVAVAEGERLAPLHPDPNPDTGRYWLQQGEYGSVKECPRYSSDWEAMGPILDRERFVIDGHSVRRFGFSVRHVVQRVGKRGGVSFRSSHAPGNTLLLASARAYAISAHGEEVSLA